MKYVLIVVLALTAVAIPAARITFCVMGTSDWWNKKQRYNLYNLAWIIGALIGVSVAPVPWWMGLILLLPVLALCAWSISAAIDHDTAGNFGALMDRITWGGSASATKARLSIRRYVGVLVLGLLAITWIVFASIAAVNGGSDSNTNQGKDHGSASAPASPQAPSAIPSSAAPSASAKPNCDVPTDGISEDAYDTKFTKSSIEVCTDGHWVSTQVKVGDTVRVEKWVQANGYEYDFISLGGKKVWTRTPYKP